MIRLSGFSCLEKTLHSFLSKNDNGKTIRINNLLFDLSKLPNIIDILNESLNISLIDDNIIKKHIQIYNTIKRIDNKQYLLIIIDFVDKIREILENKVKKYKKVDELLFDYDLFIDNVFVKYFNEYYDTENYPPFIKKHAINLINDDFIHNKCLSIYELLNNFEIIKKISMFHNNTINYIINTIIERSQNYKYGFYEPPDNNLKNNTTIFNELIKLFNELVMINIDISRFIRFIIIYIIKTNSDNVEFLYVKKMLYQGYNEIPIYNYISQLLYGKEVDEIIFINGVDLTNCNNENILDLYYLDTCKNIKHQK